MKMRLSLTSIKAIMDGHRFRVDTKQFASDMWRLGVTGRGVGQTEEMARTSARCARGCGLIVRMVEIKRLQYGTLEIEISSTCPGDGDTKPFDYEAI